MEKNLNFPVYTRKRVRTEVVNTARSDPPSTSKMSKSSSCQGLSRVDKITPTINDDRQLKTKSTGAIMSTSLVS